MPRSIRPGYAALDPAGGAREPAQRPGERARQHPGERKPEREGDETDAHQHEDISSCPVADGLHALGHANGTHAPPVVEHRDRGVEQLLAERLAVPSAL
jgi:hypothetical protein